MRSRNAMSSRITSGIGINRCDDRTITSTGWFVFPNMAIEAMPERAVTREVSRRTMLVETHSEHLILRLLRRIHETTENKLAEAAPAFAEDQLSVLYVESPPDGVRVRRL